MKYDARACQFTAPRIPDTLLCAGDSFCATGEDSNRAAAHSAASKATVRLCLARGSQPVGMSNKRLRFSVRREDSNSNNDDRSQRLKQGGVVGAAFWFFKALSRGCGKISKRNP